MFRSYFLSWKNARSSYGGAILVVVLTYVSVKISALFNEWLYVAGSVYAGSEKYTPDQFINEFIVPALIIAIVALLFGALHNYVSKKYCLRWYQTGMKHYLPAWNKTVRDISNPSERLQDSTELFVNVVFNMTKGLLHAGLMLWQFAPKLWYDSAKFKFDFFGLGQIEGVLFWIVLIICTLGVVISAFAGYNLKKCKYNIKTVRGYLRTCLEYIQRNKKKNDSVAGAERWITKYGEVSHRLFVNEFWFDIWMGVYTQFWQVAPKLFFGFNVFSGYVKYGHVSRAENEVGQVYAAISTPIWFWGAWTDYLMVSQRLRELEKTINNPENWKAIQKEIKWKERRLNIFVLKGSRLQTQKKSTAYFWTRFQKFEVNKQS
jgi:ABC-type long-subunit fatty acid transport system fused permease/ATPase subunit